jgi:hypothetical protein
VYDEDDEEWADDDEAPLEAVGAFEDEEADDEQFADDDREVVDEDRREEGDWIFGAFEDWMLEAVNDDVVSDNEELDTSEDDEAEADEFIDVFDDDNDDAALVTGSAHEQDDVPVALLELQVEHHEPYEAALSALESQFNTSAGRKKARHKKQSRRQRKRLAKARQHARKADESSKKAAAKSSKETMLPSFDRADLLAESSSVLSG